MSVKEKHKAVQIKLEIEYKITGKTNGTVKLETTEQELNVFLTCTYTRVLYTIDYGRVD